MKTKNPKSKILAETSNYVICEVESLNGISIQSKTPTRTHKHGRGILLTKQTHPHLPDVYRVFTNPLHSAADVDYYAEHYLNLLTLDQE